MEDNFNWYNLPLKLTTDPIYDSMREQRQSLPDARNAVNISLIKLTERCDDKFSYTQGEPGDF
jgi:hypothetical protein